MKKLLLLVVAVLAGYKFYKDGFTLYYPPDGAFDKNGKPKAVLFIGPNCGEPCATMQTALARRGLAYEQVDLGGKDGEALASKYRVNAYPTVLVGKKEVRGNDVTSLVSVLGETFGDAALLPLERRALRNHFDAQGRPKVVMYATKWCPFCKLQREYFAANHIAYEEIDVEASDAGLLAYGALQGAGYPMNYVGYQRFNGYRQQDLLTAYRAIK